MAGLVPAIYAFQLKACRKDVDARDNPRIKSGDGHDVGEVMVRPHRNTLYRYPATRNRSKASSASWSMARPARSGVRVVSSSAMIASIERACDGTGNVMSASPSER